MNNYNLAIVGGGFSGLLTLYHFVQSAPDGKRVAVFEPKQNIGIGLAYSTEYKEHVLNVHAGNMSAIWDQPDHLVAWLNSMQGQNASTELGVKKNWSAHDYIPRALYGQYLLSFTEIIHSTAHLKKIKIDHIRARICDLRKQDSGFEMSSENGGFYRADAAVLSIGNLISSEKNNERIICDIWAFDYRSLKNSQDPVFIIGAGLSMIDILQSLRTIGYRGKVFVVSRHALLPRAHDENTYVFKSRIQEYVQGENSLRFLLSFLKSEIKECLVQGGAWQPVFAAWRPYLPALWMGMNVRDRKRFFSFFFTIWGVHRHRISPTVNNFIQSEIKSGQVVLLKGSPQFKGINDGVKVMVGGGSFRAEYVFDCRGLSYDISKTKDPFLQSALRHGLIECHETGWGVKAHEDYRVRSNVDVNNLYVIGSLLTGERLETIAVPELRKQTYDVVQSMLKNK